MSGALSPIARALQGESVLAITDAIRFLGLADQVLVHLTPEPDPYSMDLPLGHTDDDAVDAFAGAMKAKLEEARAKGRGGWDDADRCAVTYLAQLLREQLLKPNVDPVDVANFAMFLHHRPGGAEALQALAADGYHRPA